MICMFLTNGMYLSLCIIFYVLPRASYRYIQCGLDIFPTLIAGMWGVVTLWDICTPYVCLDTPNTSRCPVCLYAPHTFLSICMFPLYYMFPKCHGDFVTPHHCGLLLYWPGCLWMSAMLHGVVPFFAVFSLCLELLLLCLQLYSSSECCAWVHQLFFPHLPWPLPWWGIQWHQVNMMWFCCHHWHQGTLEVLKALPLCHSNNLLVRCHFSLMPIMPWVLYR